MPAVPRVKKDSSSPNVAAFGFRPAKKDKEDKASSSKDRAASSKNLGGKLEDSTDAALLGDDSIGQIQNAVQAEAEKEQHCIVDSWWFRTTIILVVCLNTMQMGLEADYPELKQSVWLACENFFTSAFCIEMVIKLTVLKWDYFKDKANWLDAILTFFGVLDCWILSLLPGDGVDLQSMSILRVLRLLRLGRVVKLASRVKQFVLVISGVFKALVTTFWVFLLLVFVIYVCAIFCTEYIGQDEGRLYPGWAEDDHAIDEQGVMTSFNPHLTFGTMRNSMLTLFNIAIGGEWTEVVRPVAVKQPYFVLLFVTYSMLMAFGLMNVMMAIIVDSVIAESKKLDHEMQEESKFEKRKLLERIESLLNQIDSNNDHVVDLSELKGAYDKIPDLALLLAKCDLPAGWSASELLFMLDNSGDGVLQKSEFTTSFFRLIDSDDFQQICIMQSSLNQVKHLIRQAHDKLEIHMAEVRRALCRMEGTAFDDDPAKVKADTTLDGESDDGVIHCDFDEMRKVQVHNTAENGSGVGLMDDPEMKEPGQAEDGPEMFAIMTPEGDLAEAADTGLDGECDNGEIHRDYDEINLQSGICVSDVVMNADPAVSSKGPALASVREIRMSNATPEPYCALVDSSLTHSSPDQDRYALQTFVQDQLTTQELRSDLKNIPFQKITDIVDATCLAVKDSLLREFAVAMQAEEFAVVSQDYQAAATGVPAPSVKCDTLAEGGSSVNFSGAQQAEVCCLPQPEEEAEEGPVLNSCQAASWQELGGNLALTEIPSKAPNRTGGGDGAVAAEDYVSVASENQAGDARAEEAVRARPDPSSQTSDPNSDGDWSVDIRFDHEESLGFEIRWHPDQLPLVGLVLSGSASDAHGVLPGDELTHCNGISIRDKSRQDVLVLTKARPLVLRLQRHSHV